MDARIKKKVDKFFSAYPLRSVGKGQIMIFAGEDPTGIFYLQQGYIRQYAVAPSGAEIVVHIFQPPNFFPMGWAISRRSNRYFYQTIGEVKFYRAPVEDVLDFIRQNPDLMYELLGLYFGMIDSLFEKTVYLMSGSATNRLALEIVVGSKRFGQKEEDGSYIYRISQQELANRTGLSRETVSRDIRHVPYVIMTYGGVRVTDLDALEKHLAEQT
ncbi:MAG TPA: Crp/Fnr family transcriptional regulator [Candidatus Saccharimonadales bacterium]|nr:Crp/Fnr family transcriptional regulator [Candidatus Saccharimonadales bacterium]